MLTHRVVDAADRASSGVSTGLLRLSVGLEGVGDLWRDIDQALTVVPARTPHREAGVIALAR
jgi:cystathionine beta-lyase/cystathionine gamma-synthase